MAEKRRKRGKFPCLNQVTLMGKVLTPPKRVIANNGLQITEFYLLVQSHRATGNVEECKFKIKALGAQADTLFKWVAKLDLLLVHGRLAQRQFETRDGREAWDNYVIVENFEFMWQPRGTAVKGFRFVANDEYDRMKALADASGHADDPFWTPESAEY